MEDKNNLQNNIEKNVAINNNSSVQSPKSLKENLTKETKKRKFEINLFKKKVSTLNIVMAVKHLAIMLKSGLPLEEAIEVLALRGDDVTLRKAFSVIKKDLDSCVTLAQSMKKFRDIFSEIAISLVDVGEQGGTLEKNLLFLSDYLKKSYELQKKVRGAMIYPIIIFGMTMAEMLGVVFFLFPKLESLFASFKNKGSLTELILNISTFLRGNIGLIAVVLVVVAFILKKFLKTKTGIKFKDNLALNFPIIKNLTKCNILATFSRTLFILLGSGIPISKAIEISARTTENGNYSRVLLKIFDQVKSGQNLADSLGKYSKYFPATFTKMIEIGERTGSLEENLKY